jgi:MFS family permease
MDAVSFVDLSSVEQLANRTIQRVKWRIIPLACCLYFFNGVDRFNVGFAALGMNKALHITSVQFGSVASMFFITYLIFQVPSNMALQRIQVNRWIGFIVCGWGIVTALMFFVRGVSDILICRLLVGIFEAGFFPGMVFYFTNWFPRRVHAKVMALFMMTNAISAAVTAPISGWIVGQQWLHHDGWRWLFILEGIPTLLLGILAWLLITNTPSDAMWLDDKERSWLVNELHGERKSKKETVPASFSKIIADRTLWRLVGVYMFAQGASQAAQPWLPGIFKHLALSNTQVGFVMAVPGVCAAVAMPLWASHSDKMSERRYHAGSAVLLAGAAFLLMLVPSLPLKIVCLALFGIGSLSFWGPYWALVANLLSQESLAIGIAIINSGSSLGGFVVTYALGHIIGRFGTNGVFIFEGCLCALSFLIAMTLPAQNSGKLKMQAASPRLEDVTVPQS